VLCRNPIVIHYVHDMERAKRFYQSVFEVEPLFESSGWTTLDFGSIELALHILYPSSIDPEAPLPHAGLNLEVDDIEKIQTRVERNGGILIELREPQGGVPVRVATLRDSEGKGFELRQIP
jgi:predicted enzyme related to lactoylglutathione lyase